MNGHEHHHHAGHAEEPQDAESAPTAHDEHHFGHSMQAEPSTPGTAAMAAEQHVSHAEHEHQMQDGAHAEHAGHEAHAGHGAHVDHTGHEQMFRRRFWGSLLLSVPVLALGSALPRLLGLGTPSFPGSMWVVFAFAMVVFAYGGIPFLQMAVPEIRNREPGMMTLISLAISVAFIYSVAAQIFGLGEGFFWELVTLIDIMLLGHWLEMRSVRQASGALNELAKLMPDTAE